jgi:hypothetical protein
MANSNSLGKAYEAVAIARRRLRITHWALALGACFSLSTGAPIPHFNTFSPGAGWGIMIVSVLGWGPYLISWFYSRSRLDGNNKAVLAFSIGALIITLVAAALYQHLFHFKETPPTFLISAGVTLCLIVLSKISTALWVTAWR